MRVSILAEYGLPEGVSLVGTLAVLVPIALVTVALRWLPFGFVRALKGSDLFGLLGRMMPVGVMVVLVVYTLSGQSAAPGGIYAALLAVVATLGLHWLRRDSGLSILGGTVVYLVLVNLVF
ncbi:AzlD domain-containing protein [Corynebacterium alimapuense]|uniref:Branched-chain amino acid ABC transporter permease n=1 Tax=Corynebacterium alimapuense TaxID=1576874 RepID=A0A3M8K6I8_9CORY|nr:AzlD domain-containing protein [Corynebacterium alimapuense]RNE48114.1 branched-chain amino acid ABC transporter permease [Corynebacterium alimapuense]